MSAAASWPAPSARREAGGWRPPRRLVIGLVSVIVVLAVWELSMQMGWTKKVTLSGPSLIFNAGIRDLFVTPEGQSVPPLWPHLVESGIEYVAGLFLALVTGIPIGLGIGMSRRLNHLLEPWLSAIYATPTVAIVPLIVLILGIGLPTKIVVVWLEAIFVITVSAAQGVQAADAKFHDIAESFRASRWTRFRTVVLPASVPFLLTGVRLGVGRALVGVVVADYLAGNFGIGYYMRLNGDLQRTAIVYVGVLILGLVGIILGEVVRRVEVRFDRWRPAIN